MTYDASEQLVYGGAPVECYAFAHGATVYRYTSADEALSYQGKDYAPAVITRGEIEQNQEDHSGSLEITTKRDNDVAALFRNYLPVNQVNVTVYRFHRSDPTAGIVAFSGTVASVQFTGSEAKMSCLPISEAFRRPVPWEMFQSQCNHPLYSTACGVSAAVFAVPAVLSAVSGLTVTSATFATYADRWFCNGWLEDANGEIRWIVGHTGDDLLLVSELPGLAAGDAVTVYAGCDRTEAVCASKFNNLDNFGGWAHIPTKNPFDSSLT